MLTEVDIDNPKRLVYPRSYAHVTIELVRHPDALSVPASAIQGAGESARVLVVNDGRLVEVPVKTGINNGSYVEVTSGLSPQSLVVATYSNNLNPGQQVDCRIQNGDVQATSAAAQSSRLSRNKTVNAKSTKSWSRLTMKSLRIFILSASCTFPGAHSGQRGGCYGGITRRRSICGARSRDADDARRELAARNFVDCQPATGDFVAC